MSRIPKDVNAAVEARAAGRCELCQWPMLPEDGERHHRKLRGMGGNKNSPEDTLENLVLVHPRCHAYIHSYSGTARMLGWIVSRWDDPATKELHPWSSVRAELTIARRRAGAEWGGA
jgi:hypothetical protein